MKELKIPERIDTILNILQNIPRLQGFDRWNPVCEAMKQLADLSRDVQEEVLTMLKSFESINN